jgi:uncharacterized protein (DUF1778 family)
MKKTKVIAIEVTEEEQDLIRRCAESNGRSMKSQTKIAALANARKWEKEQDAAFAHHASTGM